MKTFCLILILSPLPTLAATLTMGEALARVEAGHPWLRTRESTAALAAARTSIAGTRPAPELSLQLENVLGTGELSAARSLETTLQFSRALDWAGRRAARVQVAAALGEAERREWEARRQELLAEAARRFIRVAAAQAELDGARREAALAGETLAALRARGERAPVPSADLARARLARTEAELAAEHAEHQLAAARHALALLWGADTPDFDSAAAKLGDLPTVAAPDVLAERLRESPAQARFASLIRWRQAEERMAALHAGRGDPRWTAGLRRVEAADDFGLVVGLNYAWPAPRLATAQSAEARAQQERTAADAATALLEARALLFELCQELNHARIEHDAAQHELLPAAEEWLAGIEAGTAAGRYGLREQLEARAAVFAAHRRRTAAAAEYHTTLVAIEQLLGGPAHP